MFFLYIDGIIKKEELDVYFKVGLGVPVSFEMKINEQNAPHEKIPDCKLQDVLCTQLVF